MNRNHRPASDALRRVEQFARCTDHELEHVLGLTTPLRVCAGAILAAEGTPVREFLIVVNGCVDVAVQGETLVTLGRDDLLGETSLGPSNPHRATITAPGIHQIDDGSRTPRTGTDPSVAPAGAA